MRHHVRALSIAIALLSAAGPARAEDAAASDRSDPRQVRTLEDVFEVFQVGKAWPEPLDLGTTLHRFLEDGPEPNRPGGANQLSGSVEGYEVGVFSNAADGTVKALFARMEDAFDAGDAARARALSGRLEAIFRKEAAGRACAVQSTLEPATTGRGKTVHRRFEVQRLRCDDGKVSLELFVDQGERELARGKTVSARAGRLGLQIRASSGEVPASK